MTEVTKDDKETTVKLTLINESYKKYLELVNFLKTLPFNQHDYRFSQAYITIDAGMLWVKEAISALKLIYPETDKDKTDGQT